VWVHNARLFLISNNALKLFSDSMKESKKHVEWYNYLQQVQLFVAIYWYLQFNHFYLFSEYQYELICDIFEKKEKMEIYF